MQPRLALNLLCCQNDLGLTILLPPPPNCWWDLRFVHHFALFPPFKQKIENGFPVAKSEVIQQLPWGRVKQTYLCFLAVVGEVVETEGAIGGVVLDLQGFSVLPGLLGIILGRRGQS